MGESCLDRESEIPLVDVSPTKAAKPDEKGRRVTSEAAKTSLTLGLLSFIFSLLAGIPAIIYGLLGLAEVRRSRGHVGGSGLAIAGMIAAAVGSLVPILLLAPAT